MVSKVLEIKRKTWWKVFLSIFTFCFILMGGTLASKSWAYTTAPYRFRIDDSYKDFNNNILDFRIFEGNLYRCTVSCTETYKKLSKEYCDPIEKYLYISPEYYFICMMFKNLNRGMKSYLVCECFAMFLIFISGLLLVITLRKRKIMIIFIVDGLLIGAIFSHYSGFISWMSITNTNFNKECVDAPSELYAYIDLCAGDGPALSLFIAIILPIILISFCFISYKFTPRLKKNKQTAGIEISKKEPIEKVENIDIEKFVKNNSPSEIE